MKGQVSNSSDRFASFFWKVVCWLWETFDLVLMIVLDYWARMVELILVLMNLTFQVICFFRDLCIDSLQTFANVFRGIVNIANSISHEDVEDFASACIVIFLYTGVAKMFVNFLRKNTYVKLFNAPSEQRATWRSDDNNNPTKGHARNVCPAGRRPSRRISRRNNRRFRPILEKSK
ncbi:PREDICTED: uncharacterized protein LOC106745098 [Dinoponera quadriceps]|uniref:Uncharacterized protein LOC106745098 n=1 Tax=Dinoponera quadriceps TaxID=609295 RepID=A0A6P3XBW7_DINQU|nr:PREDICTED: uncharacterized protein LOC106745098 [Dinoponera quadriceps]